MTDLRSAGRLRHLIEAILWSGCLILLLAIGAAGGKHAGRAKNPGWRPADQWLELQPRPILDAEALERVSALDHAS